VNPGELAHLLTPQALYAAFLSLRKDASAGVDPRFSQRDSADFHEP
jgi:hypothetical protein